VRAPRVLVLLLLAAATARAAVGYRVDRVRCTGGGDCERICPVGAVEVVDGCSVIDPDACIGCAQCQGVCSHEAIR